MASGDGWKLRSLAFPPVKEWASGSSTAAYGTQLLRVAAAKKPCSSEQSLAFRRDSNAGTAPSLHDTTKMTNLHWSATRGLLAAEVNCLDYLGSPDGRETILDSILSNADQPLRAARRSWSSAVGRLGCRRALVG